MTTRSGKALRSTERRSTGEGIGRAPFIAHAAPYVARRQVQRGLLPPLHIPRPAGAGVAPGSPDRLGGQLVQGRSGQAPAVRRRSLRPECVTRVRPPGQRLVQRPPRLRQLGAQSTGFQRPVGPAYVERRIREGPLQLGYPSFGGAHRLFKGLGLPLRRAAGLLSLPPPRGGLARLRSCGLIRSRFLCPPRPVPGGLLVL